MSALAVLLPLCLAGCLEPVGRTEVSFQRLGEDGYGTPENPVVLVAAPRTCPGCPFATSLSEDVLAGEIPIVLPDSEIDLQVVATSPPLEATSGIGPVALAIAFFEGLTATDVTIGAAAVATTIVVHQSSTSWREAPPVSAPSMDDLALAHRLLVHLALNPAIFTLEHAEVLDGAGVSHTIGDQTLAQIREETDPACARTAYRQGAFLSLLAAGQEYTSVKVLGGDPGIYCVFPRIVLNSSATRYLVVEGYSVGVPVTVSLALGSFRLGGADGPPTASSVLIDDGGFYWERYLEVADAMPLDVAALTPSGARPQSVFFLE